MMIDNQLDPRLVNAREMSHIEGSMFAAGMPVAALMEKVGQKISQQFQKLYPLVQFPKVGILVGVGHNGADALVVARELWHQGYKVRLCYPINRTPKPLTKVHSCYARALGIPTTSWQELADCDVLIDGIFGFGLDREIQGELAQIFIGINEWKKPLVSIDLPSGIHTDTGAVMGVAIEARHTFCLGMWKQGLFAENAVPYIGELIGIDFDIPKSMIEVHLHQNHFLRRISPRSILEDLAQYKRHVLAHKYSQGQVLLVVGSVKYGGAALLAALASRAMGTGMITVCVPKSLRQLILEKIPDALVVGCPETESGAIKELPDLTREFEQNRYQAIVCGCGLSLETLGIVQNIIRFSHEYAVPLVLDADGLNLLSQLYLPLWESNSQPNLKNLKLLESIQFPPHLVLTPHWGEFKRLFPNIAHDQSDRFTQLKTALDKLAPLHQKSITIVLKGARTLIGSVCHGSEPFPLSPRLWVNPESTPALARGGTGDVLAGMIGGLIAQGMTPKDAAIQSTVWHAQTAIYLTQLYTERGVTPLSLVEYLLPFLQNFSPNSPPNQSVNLLRTH